jgi:hypothetical protein
LVLHVRYAGCRLFRSWTSKCHAALTNGSSGHPVAEFEPGFFDASFHPFIAGTTFHPFESTFALANKNPPNGGLHNPPTAMSRTVGVISHGAVKGRLHSLHKSYQPQRESAMRLAEKESERSPMPVRPPNPLTSRRRQTSIRGGMESPF